MELRVPALRRAALLACAAFAFCACPMAARAAEGTAPLAPPPIPAPLSLAAEPTPNDNGTHLTVRWPRLPAEIEERAAEQRWAYVVYMAVDPSWRWFECGTLKADGGLVTSDAVSPFYPYRFGDGSEHFFIVSPLEVPGAAIHWLPAQKQSLDWLEGSRATLQQCESSLAALKKTIEERKTFMEETARYRPLWERKATEAGSATVLFAGYLKSADARERGLAEAVVAGRDGILDNLAHYFLLNALVGAEEEDATRSVRAGDLPDIERRCR
jgi:hypothetical protein